MIRRHNDIIQKETQQQHHAKQQASERSNATAWHGVVPTSNIEHTNDGTTALPLELELA